MVNPAKSAKGTRRTTSTPRYKRNICRSNNLRIDKEPPKSRMPKKTMSPVADNNSPCSIIPVGNMLNANVVNNGGRTIRLRNRKSAYDRRSTQRSGNLASMEKTENIDVPNVLDAVGLQHTDCSVPGSSVKVNTVPKKRGQKKVIVSQMLLNNISGNIDLVANSDTSHDNSMELNNTICPVNLEKRDLSNTDNTSYDNINKNVHAIDSTDCEMENKLNMSDYFGNKTSNIDVSVQMDNSLLLQSIKRRRKLSPTEILSSPNYLSKRSGGLNSKKLSISNELQENGNDTIVECSLNRRDSVPVTRHIDETIEYVVKYYGSPDDTNKVALPKDNYRYNTNQQIGAKTTIAINSLDSSHSPNKSITNTVLSNISSLGPVGLCDDMSNTSLENTIHHEAKSPDNRINKSFNKSNSIKSSTSNSPIASTKSIKGQDALPDMGYTKHSNKIPFPKWSGLPVIRLTQGEGNCEKRQVGFAPINIAPNLQPVKKFSMADSMCSASSTGEDFTEYLTDAPYWPATYKYDVNEKLKISSLDDIFTGATLSILDSPGKDALPTKSVSTIINIKKTFIPSNPSASPSLSDNEERLYSPPKSASNEKQRHPDLVKKLFQVSNQDLKQHVINTDENLDLPEDISDKANVINSYHPSNKNLSIDNRLSIPKDSRTLTSVNFREVTCAPKVPEKCFPFKIPLLPPAKRPPWRSKSSASSSSSADSASSSFKSEPLSESPASRNVLLTEEDDDEDDVISIYTESISDINETPAHLQDNRPTTSRRTPNNVLKQTTIIPVKNQTAYIENQARSSPLFNSIKQHNGTLAVNKNETLLETKTLAPEPLLSIPNGEVAQWTSTGHYSNKMKVDFSVIPAIFRTLCYYNYTIECYKSKSCMRAHTIPAKIFNRLPRLPYDLLKSAYDFAKDRYKLYSEVFCSFVDGLQKYPDKFELVSIVDDIFQIVDGDKLSFVKKLISAMKDQGQLFSDIIWDIMFREGSKNIALLDILLIIVCEEKQELLSNWNLVKKLCKYRNQEYINFNLIQDIMIYCVESRDRGLCKNIMNDIVSCCKVELYAINISTINRFYSLLRILELHAEADIFNNQLNAHNIYPLHSHDGSNMNNQISKIPMSTNQNENHIPVQQHLHDINDGITCLPSYFTKEQNTFINPDERSQNVSPASGSFILPTTGLQYNDKESSLFSNYKASNLVFTNDKVTNLPLLAFSPLSTRDSDPDIANMFKQTSLPNSSSPNYGESYNNGLFNIHSKSTSPLFLNSMNTYDPQMCTTSPSHANSRRTSINILRHDSSITSDMFDVSDKELPEDDVKELQDIIIKRASYVEFIIMLNKFKNTAYSRSFLINTICLFKNNRPERTCQLFKEIIEELAIVESSDSELQKMMRTLCVNVIAVLDTQNAFERAAAILAIFYKDIHALINIKWFSVHKYKYSDIGKYFYFCRIFTKGGIYKLAFELFTSPELKLLHRQHLWTIPFQEDFDVMFRNSVLVDFISLTLKNDLGIAMHLILHMFTDKNCILEINVSKYYNMLICRMVDCGLTYLNELKSMLPSILEGWHRYLTDPVLRGLLVVLVPHSPLNVMMSLYSKCCLRGLYPKIKGCETSIPLRTDMTHEEIFMIFSIYLHNLSKCKYAVNDLVFQLLLSQFENQSPKILTNASGSVRQLKAKVCSVLAKAFRHTINVSPNDNEPYIKIEREKMRAFLQTYNNIHPET